MGLKRELAGASAGTLGFISGNVPGAVAGYKLGKMAYDKFSPKDMYVTKKKGGISKKYKSSITTVGGKRRKVRKSTGDKKNKKLSNSMNQSNETVVHKKKKDTLKLKNPYKVKVSPDFRKKVLKAVSDKEPQGSATITFVGGFFAPNNDWGWPLRLSVKDQWVYGLPLGNSSTAYDNGLNIRSGELFKSNILLHCASRLWNGAAVAANQNDFSYGRLDNFCNPEGTDKAALKLDILKSWAVIEMKNVTRTKLRLYMYVCAPKYMRRSTFTYQNQWQCLPAADWNDQLIVETNARVDGNNTIAPQITSTGINVSGVGASAYGLFPEQTASWRKLWNFEKFEIVLEPGQEHRHVVNGYTGPVDFSKYYRDSNFQNIVPQDRHVMFVMQTDLGVIRQGTPLASYGARTSQIFTDVQAGCGIIFETKLHYKLQMPEPAGARMPATGILGIGAYNKPLGYRRRCFMYDIVSQPGLTFFSEALDVDDNNPTELK